MRAAVADKKSVEDKRAHLERSFALSPPKIVDNLGSFLRDTMKFVEGPTGLYLNTGSSVADIFDPTRQEYLGAGGTIINPITGRREKVSSSLLNDCVEALILDSAIPTFLTWEDCQVFVQCTANVSAFVARNIPPGTVEVKFYNRVSEVLEKTAGIRLPAYDTTRSIEENMKKVYGGALDFVTMAAGKTGQMKLTSPSSMVAATDEINPLEKRFAAEVKKREAAEKAAAQKKQPTFNEYLAKMQEAILGGNSRA